MTKAQVQEVDGSLMLVLPESIIERLHLTPASEVEVTLADEKILVHKRPRRRYSLDELIAMSDPLAFEQTDEDREWLNSPPVGRELI